MNETTKRQAAYMRAVERELSGLSAVSSGTCPGCEECGVPHPADDPHCDASAPLIFDNNALTGAHQLAHWTDDPRAMREHATALRTVDDGWGSLYVYGEEFGPTHVVRAGDESDAIEVVYDELTPVAPEDAHEAYGFDNRDEWEAWIETHPDEYPELIEGYAYQANAGDGTGIVAPSPHEWIRELTRSVARELRIVVETDACDDWETEFSWSACDACGSTLGGDRTPAHGLDTNGAVLHMHVCVDCVEYLANGDLPEDDALDWTGEPAAGEDDDAGA